jgi:hypothetical protein
LATGAELKVKGSRFELEYAVKHADDIIEIGRPLGSRREIDFILKNGTFVDTKNWNLWAKYYQNPENLARSTDRLIEQARVYLSHTDEVEFVFAGNQPAVLLDAISNELREEFGKKVIVRVIDGK